MSISRGDPDKPSHRFTKIVNLAIPVLAAGLLLTGCIAGGAYPEKDGRAYLEKRGHPEDQISRLVDGKRLTPQEVEEFQSSRSTDVRFLIARHPVLDNGQISTSVTDKDDFVRSGAARNPNLSSDQIETLTHDKSHTVYSALAGNTSLSDKQLMRIRKTRNLDNLWFSSNPNCPTPIRKAIASSGDSMAKEWLEQTDEWKKEGIFVRDKNGRWHRAGTAP